MSQLPFQNRDNQNNLLLEVIASVLDELVRKGEEERKTSKCTTTKFHGLRAPSINLTDYLQRISQFSGCSNECFVLMLVYVDRLVTNKGIPLDALNVHRLVITGILLAAKFFDDHYLDNAHYSAVGGLPPHEINQLELEFLFLLGFNLYVSTEKYGSYHDSLTNMLQARNPTVQCRQTIPGHEEEQWIHVNNTVVQQSPAVYDEYNTFGQPYFTQSFGHQNVDYYEQTPNNSESLVEENHQKKKTNQVSRIPPELNPTYFAQA